MPIANESTYKALAAFAAGKSHRVICRELGLSESWRGTIGRVLNKFPVGHDKELVLREKLGVVPRKRKRYFRPCLSKELESALGVAATSEDVELILWDWVVDPARNHDGE